MSEAQSRPAPADERRLRIHALVVDLLGELMRAPLDAIDNTIAGALERVGRFCDVDRTYVFRLGRVAGAEVVDNTHEWCAPGVAPMIALCRNLPGEMVDPWRAVLEADACVDVCDVDALADGELAKAHLQAQGIRSILVVPMRAGGRFSGFVGLDAVRDQRVFSDEETLLLKSLADAIGSVLARADDAGAIARAQASLAEAHDRLMATLRALPDLILEVDGDGRYTDVHTSDPGQMMVPPEALIGRTHEEAMPAEIAELNRRAMAEVDSCGHSGPHPFWAETPRGLRRYVVSVSPRPALRPGETPGYVFVARDVSDEWRLQRETEKLSLIARRMTDLVMVIGLDNRIEWVNPAFEARTGWSLDEVRGRTPPEILHCAGSDRAELERIAREMAAGHAVRGELLNQTRSGEEFWTEIDIQPLHDAGGKLTGFVSIETDITARKAQAVMLQRLAGEATEARDRLQMAVEALPDAFAYFDSADRLVLCNQRHRDLYPATGKLMTPGAHRDALDKAALAHGEGQLHADDVLETERGHVVVHQAGSGVSDAGGSRWLRVIERRTPDGGRVGMRVDISAIKEAERRLADIIHGAEAGTWEWRLATGSNLVNGRWAEILGYTVEELSPLTIDVWRALVHPEDMNSVDQQLARVFTREIDQFEYELRMRHKAGHWVWVLSRGRVARWSPDGRPELMAGVHIDITALKRAEERLEQIIDAAAAGTWEYDFSHGQKHINDRWAEMLGYCRAELSEMPGLGFRELVHPDDMAVLDRMHDERLMRGETHFANEIRMRHRDGHWVWILSRGQVIERDASGRPLRSAGIHLDITDRKRLEVQLMAERDYLSRLMETSASGIAALDGAGKIIFANREAERILGRDNAILVGMQYDAATWQIGAVDGGPLDLSELPFSRVMTEGRTVRDVRFAIRWPDGSRRILQVNAAPISAEGLAVRVVCSINDITEQVAAEGELRAAAERAEAANQAKSRFLANMSHEIRTPLNGVLGMAQVLEEELREPRHRQMLGIIRESGETLLNVLNDILDMSKIEAGKLTLEALPFELGAVAARIEAMHRLDAEAKGLRFEMRVAGPDTTSHRCGDPNRLSQVLHNLIGNAVKFTETGGVTVSISDQADERVEIRVRDTGIGMTQAQLARVFEDFEQADGTVTRRFGGTGLGMSIVRRLVALMQGEIFVESTPGCGTEVVLRLPLPRAGWMRPADEPPQARPLKGMRVLAADDNVTNRMILKAMLTGLGIDAVIVADGRAAVRAWEAGRFDAFLLDISMPELDGMSALAELRTCELARGVAPTPALAITANAMSHQVAEYVDAGFAAHLGKPFRREDLASALAQVAQGRD